MKRTFAILLLLAGPVLGQVIETNLETGMILLPVKDAATHEMLRASLRDHDPLVRIQGLVALATIRDPADTPAIHALETDPVATVRDQAGKLPPPATVPLAAPANPADWLGSSNVLRRQIAVDAIARRHLTELGPALPALLGTPDSVLRRHVCEALGQLRAGQSAALATQLAHDDDPLVRRAAAEALLALHTDAAEGALVTLLKHDHAPVRLEAARALGNWAQPGVALSLHPLLADTEPTVARTAAEALGKLANPESQPPLLTQFPNSPVSVQERIAWALGEFKTAAAAPVLLPFLKSGPEQLEASVAEALGKIGDKQAIPPVRKILVEMKTHGALARQRAVEALRRLGDRESTKRALQLLTDKVVPPPPGATEWSYDSDAVRAEALRYLGFAGDAQVAAEFMGKLKDLPSWQLRQVLIATLAQLTGKTYRAEFTVDARRYLIESLTGEFYPKSPAVPGVVEIPPR